MTFYVFFLILLERYVTTTVNSFQSSNFVNYDPPTIVPQRESQTVKSGGNVNFRCEGSRGVSWRLPIDASSTLRARVSLIHSQESPSSFISVLSIIKLQYTDTGTFLCTYNGTRDTESIENSTKVHLYVEDERHLLKQSGYEFLQAIQSETFILQCQPTHPNVSVTLWRDGYGQVEMSQFMSFDPKIGFRISPVTLEQHTGDFICQGSFGGRLDKYRVSLNVLVKTKFVPKPYINRTLARYIPKGGQFKLSCSVTVDVEVLVKLSWITPNHLAINQRRIDIPESVTRNLSLGGSHLKVVEQNLIIHGATIEDQGNYECKIQDHSGNTQSAKEFVRIMSEEDSYIRLSYDGYQTLHQDVHQIHEPVQWVVQIEAYPEPNVTWYGPRNEPIVSSSEYKVRTVFGSNSRTFLKILNVDLSKSGVYTLKVMNQNHVQTKNFTLIVRSEPKVEMYVEGRSSSSPGGGGTTGKSSQLYQLGQEYNLRCEAKGSPLPDINWLFKNCVHYDLCDSSPTKNLQSYSTEKSSDGTSRNSFLKVVASHSGKIICQSCNDIDCNFKVLPFFITDVQDSEGLQVTSVSSSILEGQPTELKCSASLYNFTEITWYKHRVSGSDKEMKNSENIVVTSISSDFSFHKILRFRNVSLRDHGRYVCKAKSSSSALSFSLERNYELDIIPLEAPTLDSLLTSLNNDAVIIDSGSEFEFRCKVGKGTPWPTISWSLNGRPLNLTGSSRLQLSQQNQSLRINYVTSSDEGLYTCLLSSPIGSIVANQRLSLRSSSSSSSSSSENPKAFFSQMSLPILIGALCVAVIFVGLTVLLSKVCIARNARKWKAHNDSGPPIPRLTQFELPTEGPDCSEDCRLTLTSRDGSISPPFSNDCSCSLHRTHCPVSRTNYSNHREPSLYSYSKCSLCDYSATTLPINRLMNLQRDYERRSASPSKLSAQF